MKWTFGIITSGNNDHFLIKVIGSIIELNIPSEDFEIIVVGNTGINHPKLKKIPFNENIKINWITKKKNLIAQSAIFDNIVMLHDYICFEKGWYEAFQSFGEQWDVCMTRITNTDGKRFRDWVTWSPITLVPYSNTSHTREMYVSGAYFCVKKQFMLANPLDENLSWGEGEDVEWSQRVRDKWQYRCNEKAGVYLLKNKGSAIHGILSELYELRIFCFLYDLDGVLVDACDWHYDSLNMALKKVVGYEINETDHKTIFNGLPTKTKLAILEQKGIVKQEQFEEIFNLKQLYTKTIINQRAAPDISKINLHNYCSHLGIYEGCVTNSIRETANLMLESTGQRKFMHCLVTNEDVSIHKPDPAPYLKAFSIMGIHPSNVLIIEDSDKGIESAIASGANVMRVKNATEVNCDIIFEPLSSKIRTDRIVKRHNS